MVGDSCTAFGQEWRSLISANQPELEFTGTKTDGTYLHEGVGGDKTTDIIDRLDAVPVADTYILLAGGNDLRAFTWRGVIVDNLQLIADALAEKGGRVYVLTPMPTALGGDVNTVLSRLRWDIKSGIVGHTVIDTFQAYVDSGYTYSELCIADKVHPSALGYQVLAGCIANNI